MRGSRKRGPFCVGGLADLFPPHSRLAISMGTSPSNTSPVHLSSLRQALHAQANPDKARVLSGFFKTGPGHYGEGDQFLGVTVPQLRALVRLYSGLALEEMGQLIDSGIHEERMLGLLLLVRRYDQACRQPQPTQTPGQLFDFYMGHLAGINNWDLVDVTSPNVVGHYLFHHASQRQAEMDAWAASDNLWLRRIAMVSTLYFIRQGYLDPTFRLAEVLQNDPHDLMHKAVGWMLREAGKKDMARLEAFLWPRRLILPRTLLRYAIEKFPEDKRQAYLAKK